MNVYEFKEERQTMIDAAPGAIDQYERMLTAPDTHPWHLSGLYSVILGSNVDQKRFLPAALRHLTHSGDGVRLSATTFVGRVGTAADSGPLLVLLSDPKSEVGYAAARSLGQLGDDRTVIALELWLRFACKPGDDPAVPQGMAIWVTKARDEIKARLAALKPAP